jgi:hypothetical protein
MAVVELVVTPPRLDAWHRLQEAADWVVVLTECSGAAARADRRDRADPLLNRADVLAALGHESIDDYLVGGERDVIRATMQREFDVPVLRVDTDDGYNPEMPAIVDWIIEQTRHHD